MTVRRRKGFTLVVSGPSGAGKSSLCRDLVERDPGLGMCVTTTTRPPRPDEAEGRDRFFLTEAAFRERLDRGAFAEWASVHGHLYGTTWEALRAAQRDHDVVVLDVDVQGGAFWRRELGRGCVTVFVAPPSMEVLRGRLLGRGPADPAELDRRMRNAREEMGRAPDYDYLVFNDRFDEAAALMRSIVEAERCRTHRWEGNLCREAGGDPGTPTG
jgi:guanylate kinase